jgi:hypothetical protein
MIILQGPKLLYKLLQDATVKHPDIKESTHIPFGLANVKYGPVKSIILMHREKHSQQELDGMMKDKFGETPVQIYFWDDLLLQHQQPQGKVPTNTATATNFPKLTRNDLATIGNLLHQTSHRWLPVVPTMKRSPCQAKPWSHFCQYTERSFQIWMVSRCGKVVYSTIPDISQGRDQNTNWNG